jgi:hypothetical protein
MPIGTEVLVVSRLAEGGGIEPPEVTLPRFSRPVADHSAAPSSGRAVAARQLRDERVDRAKVRSTRTKGKIAPVATAPLRVSARTNIIHADWLVAERALFAPGQARNQSSRDATEPDCGFARACSPPASRRMSVGSCAIKAPRTRGGRTASRKSGDVAETAGHGSGRVFGPHTPGQTLMPSAAMSFPKSETKGQSASSPGLGVCMKNAAGSERSPRLHVEYA